jgi:hypothetical protein
MTPDVVQRIGHLPEGKGLLGALVDDPHAVRLLLAGRRAPHRALSRHRRTGAGRCAATAYCDTRRGSPASRAAPGICGSWPAATAGPGPGAGRHSARSRPPRARPGRDAAPRHN